MANLNRPKPKSPVVKDPYTISREHERNCEGPLERKGREEVFDKKKGKYVRIGELPKVGDIEECEHGWVLHVSNVYSYSTYVTTLKPGSSKYRKAKRIIRRERRAKVLEERRAGRAETA